MLPSSAGAQQRSERWFAGGAAGVFALSPDSTITIGSESASSAGYSANSGIGFQVFGGRHLNNYFSLQAGYITNRHRLEIDTSLAGEPGDSRANFSENTRLHSVVGEALF